MSYQITPDSKSLLIIILAVGDGDSMIIRLPKDNEHEFIMIDCKRSTETKQWLDAFEAQKLALVVATHPHYDHIAGLKSVMTHLNGQVDQFWDSGFRHTSTTWDNLAEYIGTNTDAQFLRPTSGMYTTYNGVKFTVLAPSIYLRNRYDTYGVNINNASIVLKLEYQGKTVILAGDAQWDSWGKITEEFPQYVKTENPDRHVQVDTSHKPLKCNVLKVAHHGSKHGTSLEPVEILNPNYAIITRDINSEYGFPHEITLKTLQEVNTKILDTATCGNVMIEITSGGTLKVYQQVSAVNANTFDVLDY